MVRLALGQLVSWGTLFYALTFLAAPIGRDAGWSPRSIFGGFTFALIVAGFASPFAGRAFLRWGARTTLGVASLIAALGLAILASAPGRFVYFAGWGIAGLAMALGLYEGAFAALREFAGSSFRRSVVHVTLIGGLASTIFWPLCRWLEEAIGWRGTLWVYCALHLIVVLPIHAGLPRRAAQEFEAPAVAPPLRERLLGRLERRLVWLAIAFSSASFVAAGIAAHLAGWFHELGIDERTTLVAGIAFGPSQVLARALDLWTEGRWSWRRLGLLLLVLQVGALVLLATASMLPAAPLLFALLFGASNGLLTVVRPLALAESETRAFVTGLFVLSAATLAGRAVAPLAFAGLRGSLGARATLGVCVACLAVACLAWALSLRPGTAGSDGFSATPAAPGR